MTDAPEGRELNYRLIQAHRDGDMILAARFPAGDLKTRAVDHLLRAFALLETINRQFTEDIDKSKCKPQE